MEIVLHRGFAADRHTHRDSRGLNDAALPSSHRCYRAASQFDQMGDGRDVRYDGIPQLVD